VCREQLPSVPQGFEKKKGYVKYNIVTYKPIARQRLGKHIPAGANGRKNRRSIARQRISKHA
jgi:hypothetical protein